MDNNYLAKKAAWCAASDVNWNVTSEDIQDMRQEAALAIWRNLGKGERYAFRCGVNAARLWWRRYVADWRNNGRRPEKTPQGSAVSLTLFEGESGDTLESAFATPTEDRGELSRKQIAHLVEIFLEARIHKGKRGRAAAVRDAQIVALLCQGYDNAGIAHVLGIPHRHVRQYRRRIRRILGGY